MIGISLERGDLSEAILQLIAMESDLLHHEVEISTQFFNLIPGADVNHLMEVPLSSQDGRFHQFRNGFSDASRKENGTEVSENDGEQA